MAVTRTSNPTDTILVTGAAGFVGSAVADRLRVAGRRVVGLDMVSPPGASMDHVEADVCDADRVYSALAQHRPGCVVHAGAISGPMVLPDDPRRVFEINVLGTLNVLESARHLGIARVVFLSSFIAYGDQPDDGLVAEDRALGASDAYGCSKIAGEAMARTYQEHHGVEAVSLRLGAVYGPGRTTRCFVRALLEDVIAGRETAMDFGARWHRSYVHVDDVVCAIEASVDAPRGRLRQHAYNIAGGTWPRLDEVARTAADAVPGVRSRLAPGRVPFDYRIGPLDLSAAARDLGYQPQVSLREGISRYHAWLATRA